MRFSTLMLPAAAIFSMVHATPFPEALPFSGTSIDNSTIGKRAKITGTVQFFSSNACNGGAGGVSPISLDATKCVEAPNRHSFVAKGCDISMSFFEAAGCKGNYYTSGAFNRNTCINVNTGRPWGSSWVRCTGTEASR